MPDTIKKKQLHNMLKICGQTYIHFTIISQTSLIFFSWSFSPAIKGWGWSPYSVAMLG